MCVGCRWKVGCVEARVIEESRREVQEQRKSHVSEDGKNTYLNDGVEQAQAKGQGTPVFWLGATGQILVGEAVVGPVFCLIGRIE